MRKRSTRESVETPKIARLEESVTMKSRHDKLLEGHVTMKKYDGVSPRFSRFPRVFVASALLASAALLASTNLGCRPQNDLATHGASQIATAQEQERQNRNLIDQVVRATEEQENFPDPTYLRGALGRINSWLESRPKTEDFEADAEFAALAVKCRDLAAIAKRANRLVVLFRDKNGKPTQKDADELQELVDKAQAELGPLAEKLASNSLREFASFADDLKKKLSSAKEFQFADATETFQTQIRQLDPNDFYNFETLSNGLESFAALLQVDGRSFLPEDAEFLKESVWLRNVFNWAKGEKQADLAVVQSLFDWTVKNILLTKPVEGPAGPIAQLPWQTILTSQGTALDRALVFIELLRQHRLDAFILRPANESAESSADFPLVVGVRVDGETRLYLPEWGVPIPDVGSDSVSLKTSGNNAVGLSFDRVATLFQVAENDALLRRFDLDPERPFPAKSSQFEKMTAFVPSTPFLASERMISMEQEFSGTVHTVLSTPFERQKARIAELPGIAAVERLPEANAPILEQLFFPIESEILTRPYRYALAANGSLEVSDGGDKTDDSIADYTKSNDDSAKTSADGETSGSTKKSLSAPLWIGKILYLKGNFVDGAGAAHWFQQGRVSDRILKEEASQIPQKTNQVVENFLAWNRSQKQTPSDEEIQELARQTVGLLQADLGMKRYIKIATKYYLALISEAAGNDESAISHLQDPGLQQTSDVWRSGATYLLARIFEKQGNAASAVRLYRSEPNDFGRLWRAKTLAELAGLKKETPESVEKAPESALVPKAPSVVPDEKTDAPEVPANVPDEKTDAPEVPANVPDEKTDAPEVPASVPDEKTDAPEVPASVPDEEPAAL